MLPPLVGLSVSVTGLSAKFAVTFLIAFIGTAHVAPVQSPLKPVNVEFADATGRSVTSVFAVNVAESVVHAAPQLIPAGLDVIAPVPLPPFVRLNANVLSVKFATMVWA